jgi:hypothetical protein
VRGSSQHEQPTLASLPRRLPAPVRLSCITVKNVYLQEHSYYRLCECPPYGLGVYLCAYSHPRQATCHMCSVYAIGSSKHAQHATTHQAHLSQLFRTSDTTSHTALLYTASSTLTAPALLIWILKHTIYIQQRHTYRNTQFRCLRLFLMLSNPS